MRHSALWLSLALGICLSAHGCQAQTAAEASGSPQRTGDQLEHLGPPAEVDATVAAELSGAFRAAARQALPAVAFIRVEKPASKHAQAIPEPFRRFFGLPEDHGALPPQEGMGSGFIIDRVGHIVTNSHVVSGATYVQVRMVDGSEYEAKVVGDDPSTDIALLRIEPVGDLPIAEFGSSADLRVGDWVLALGSPLGLDFTVTTGIISAKGRRLSARENSLEAFLQTDAAINPGNSGGPLVDLTGKVIGVSTAIYGGPRFVGYGFAIPIDLVRRVVDDLIEYGEVRRPRLGVQISDVTATDAEAYNLENVSGADVNLVEQGSPAEAAGIEIGDVIVAVDGEEIEDSSDLVTTLVRRHPGDEVSLELIRDGRRMTVDVKLGKFESDTETGPSQPEHGDTAMLGFQAETLTPTIASRLGIDMRDGAVVTEVRPFSAAAGAGIRPGMVVVALDGEPVGSAADLARAAEDIREGDVVSLRLVVPELGETIVNYRTR